MNTNHLCSIITAGGLVGVLCLVTTASAIEPPPDEATPPAALLEEGDARAERPASRATMAKPSSYLGVSTAEVPEMLADHLGLSARSGVIIRTIVPDSPAERAGLVVNDVITRLDGSPVADPGAFTSAIRARKPGDRLMIDLIHRGKPKDIGITLGDRPADAAARIGPQPRFEGMEDAGEAGLRGLFGEDPGAFGPGRLEAFPDERFGETFRQMRERMNRAFGEDSFQGSGFQNRSSFSFMDEDGSVEIASSEGKTEAKVRDTRNRIIWSGPWDTEEDKAAAPAEIRDRIDRVKAGKGSGFSFRFGSPRGGADPEGN